MSIIPRRIYRTVEHYLYNYHEEKRKLQDIKEDIINSSPPEFSQYGGGVSYHSDPTAQKAIKLTKENIRKKELWLSVVDDLIRHYEGTEKGKFIQKKYIDELGIWHVCEELHISRATLFNWRDEIIYYAVLLAVSKGLISIEDIKKSKTFIA